MSNNIPWSFGDAGPDSVNTLWRRSPEEAKTPSEDALESFGWAMIGEAERLSYCFGLAGSICSSGDCLCGDWTMVMEINRSGVPLDSLIRGLPRFLQRQDPRWRILVTHFLYGKPIAIVYANQIRYPNDADRTLYQFLDTVIQHEFEEGGYFVGCGCEIVVGECSCDGIVHLDCGYPELMLITNSYQMQVFCRDAGEHRGDTWSGLLQWGSFDSDNTDIEGIPDARFKDSHEIWSKVLKRHEKALVRKYMMNPSDGSFRNALAAVIRKCREFAKGGA